MFLCHLPVFFNTHEVDQGCATRHGEDVDEGGEPIKIQVNQDKDGAESLKDPIEHVELHRDQISVSSLHSNRVTDATHILVLILTKPNRMRLQYSPSKVMIST